jgi:hypothetical protein
VGGGTGGTGGTGGGIDGPPIRDGAPGSDGVDAAIDGGIDLPGPEVKADLPVDLPPDQAPDLAADRPPDLAPDGPLPVGTGLRGDYFDGSMLELGDTGALDASHPAEAVDFDWGTGRPDPVVDNDWFSVRWSGQVMPLYSETYTFRTLSDEGVRLWVDGKLIIDHWLTQTATSRTGTIALSAYRRYDIKLEYFEQTGSAVARLYWSSPSQASEIVRKACLFPPP